MVWNRKSEEKIREKSEEETGNEQEKYSVVRQEVLESHSEIPDPAIAKLEWDKNMYVIIIIMFVLKENHVTNKMKDEVIAQLQQG